MRVLGVLFLFSIFLLQPMGTAEAKTQDFHAWLVDLRVEALERGFSPELVMEALPDTLKPRKKVVTLDRKQPEKKITFERYKQNVLTAQRVREGRSRIQKHKKLLNEISAVYGVEPEFIVSLWGMETSFGRNMGGFKVIPALATLAYDGRRSAFFRKELFKALEIVQDGHISLADMKGSWAGAMGQCQFMPTSFVAYAEDYNKDGRRDIWNTKADVFASAANYLSKRGWKKGQPWGHRVRLPKSFDTSMISLELNKPLQFWHDLGVRTLSGDSIPFDMSLSASVVQPGGKGYKTYVVFDNYKTIMKWNASQFFATSVVHLADKLKS